MRLLDDLKDTSGLSVILNELCADSPYGAAKIRELLPFAQRELLETSLHNTGVAVSLVESGSRLLDQIRRLLMNFKNIGSSVRKCEHNYLSEVELFEVKSFLLNLEKLAEVYNSNAEKLPFRGISLTAMKDALDILDPQKQRIAPFSIEDGYSPALKEIRAEKTRLERLLAENPKQQKELLERRRAIVIREEEEETKIKKEISSQLRAYSDEFYKNMDNIGLLDLTIQKALLAVKHGASAPEISTGPAVVLEDMFNPIVAEALQKNGKTFTPISLTFNRGVTMITGANMGGKSVALKTAVLNVLLFHLGFYVFAKKARMPVFDEVFLVCEDLQDISRGLSSFAAEIVKFNEIASNINSGFVFAALDEFARGTNPQEGAAVVRAVASWFAEKDSVCVMTTHYENVISGAVGHYQVAGLSNLDFEKLANEAGTDIIARYMDYRMVPAGETPPPHDALNICKLLGLDKEILDRIQKRI